MPKAPFVEEGAVPHPTGGPKRRVFAGLGVLTRGLGLVLALSAVLLLAAAPAAAQEDGVYRIDAALAENPTNEYRWVRLAIDYPALQAAQVAQGYGMRMTAAVGEAPPYLAGDGGVFVLQGPDAEANTYSIFPGVDDDGPGFAGQGGAFQLGYTGATAESDGCLALRLGGFRVLDSTRQSRDVVFVRDYDGTVDRWASYNTDSGLIKLQNGAETVTSPAQVLTQSGALTLTWCLTGARLQYDTDVATAAAVSQAAVGFLSADLALVSGHSAATAAEGSATSAWQAQTVELMTATTYTAAPVAKAPPAVTTLAPVGGSPLSIAAVPDGEGAHQVAFGSPAQWTGQLYPAGATAIAAIPPAQDVALHLLRTNHATAGRLLPPDLSLAGSVALPAGAAAEGAGFAWPLSIVGEQATAALPPLLVAALFLVGFGGIAAVGAWKATRNLAMTAVAAVVCGACIVLMTPLPEALIVLMALGGGIAAAVVRPPAGVR